MDQYPRMGDAQAATLIGREAGFLDGWLMAQEIEQHRLGRELHDVMGQLLVMLRLEIGGIRQTATAIDPLALDEMEATVSEIERHIRTLSFLHYPADLARKGLIGTLDGYAREFGRRTGLRATFTHSGPLAAIEEAHGLALLRTVQEALANVYRHAQATAVEIALKQRNGGLELTVRDDGRGMSRDCAGEAAGVGLQGMRHRLESVGGRLSIRRLSHGTKLIAFLPHAGHHRVIEPWQGPGEMTAGLGVAM